MTTSPASLDPDDEAAPPVPDTTRHRRWVGLLLLAAGALVLLWAGWVTVRVLQAADHLAEARDRVAQLRPMLDDPTDLDITAIEQELAQLQDSTAAAAGAANDPLVRSARWLPLVGDDLSAVGLVADATRTLADDVLPRLLGVGRLDPTALMSRDGRFDLGPLIEAAPDLVSADDATATVAADLATVDRSSLFGPISDAVGSLQQQVAELSEVTATGARLGRVVTGLFADDEPRTILLVIQNPAEPRATGGIPASSVLLQVADGSVELADQDPTSRTLDPFDPPLTAPEADLPVELYQGLPLIFPTDTTMTPDFPTAAALFQRMYTERTGTRVDGVLSVDPVLVSRMLKGAPDVTVPGRAPVPTADLTRYLLSTVYAEFDQPSDAQARDLVLAQVAALSFAEVLRQDPAVLLGQVRQGVADHRFQLWLADPTLQQQIAVTDLSGAFPRSTDDFGVFRNDGTGGKLGYYSDGEVTLTHAAACTDGRRPFDLTTVLSYSPPEGPLPDYVLGHAKAGPGVLRTNVMVFVPADAVIDSVTVDGAAVPSVRTSQGGRPVLMVTINQGGGSAALVVTGTTAGAGLDGAIRVTPGVEDWPVTTSAVPNC